ncbi:MAG: PBP1A family penicillin-binding protein [Myxococcota bacterium]
MRASLSPVHQGRWIGLGGVALAILLVVAAARTLGDLEARVEGRFAGRLFALPSRVYSAPMLLYPGMDVRRLGLTERLTRLRYRTVSGPAVRVGEVALLADRIRIGRRPFRSAHGQQGGGVLDVEIGRDGRIRALRDGAGSDVPVGEIEPELLGELHGVDRADRRLVLLEQVPTELVDAIVSVEDQRFFDHPCIDLRRMVGALVANVQALRVVQGASTLTQQLVKNFYLGPERTLGRKLREVVMACLLERRHSKEEILETYLNEVYLGQRGSVAVHGVGEAAFHYFAKRVEDLTLSEAALIAGLIKGPNLYSPFRHPTSARARRDLVLGILRARELIEEERFLAALEEPMVVGEQPREERPAPYFVDHLRTDLVQVYGEEILHAEGFSIHTTLDPHLQRLARRAIQRGIERLEGRATDFVGPKVPLQAALVALNPRTGEIMALVGGRDYATSQFSRATMARRQPGSIFKPVVALAALAGRGGGVPSHTAVSSLLDAPLEVDGPQGTWRPVNYDGEFRGPVTLRAAIERSLNVPVARLGLELGPERIIETARKMGLPGPFEPVASLALGVSEVTLLGIARAYAVLAAGGVRPVLRSYREVLDVQGNVVKRTPLRFERVFSREETYLVTSLLEGVIERGTGRGLRARGFLGPVAGKTGTTSGFRDAWFVAYIPDLLVAAWVGFDDGQSLEVPGSVAALPLVADFLLDAVGPEGRGGFARPPGVTRVSVDPHTGLLAGGGCPGTPEVFLAGTAPTLSCSPGAVERLIGWMRKRL